MLIVEIGQGVRPIYEYSGEVKRKLDAGATYVGIDLDQPSATYVNIDRDKGCYFGLIGDLNRIPLVGGTASEIWIANVFSGAIRKKLHGGYYTLVNYTNTEEYFRELHRVLKPNGVVNFVEWLPRVFNIDWLHKTDYIKFGFAKKVFSGKSVHRFIDRYEIAPKAIALGESCVDDTPPFFVTLTKTSIKKP